VLDVSSKPKPVAGPDDLLLLLAQHWARDQSVFPTEDDRLDLPTIMLFQSYTGCRPAELVHASRGKACQDALGQADDGTDRGKGCRVRRGSIHNRGSRDEDDPDDFEDTDVYESDDASNTMPAAAITATSTNESEITMTKDTADCHTVKLNNFGIPIQGHSPSHPIKLGQQQEPTRQYKALCYEDVCLWIVPNPKLGERDLLVMEVHLRYHKGVDKNPKPYATLLCGPSLANPALQHDILIP